MTGGLSVAMELSKSSIAEQQADAKYGVLFIRYAERPSQSSDSSGARNTEEDSWGKF